MTTTYSCSALQKFASYRLSLVTPAKSWGFHIFNFCYFILWFCQFTFGCSGCLLLPRLFSSCGTQGLLSSCGWAGCPLAMAPLVEEHGLQAPGPVDSPRGPRSPGSIVAAHERSCSTGRGIFWTRDQTCVPHTGRQTLPLSRQGSPISFFFFFNQKRKSRRNDHLIMRNWLKYSNTPESG